MNKTPKQVLAEIGKLLDNYFSMGGDWGEAYAMLCVYRGASKRPLPGEASLNQIIPNTVRKPLPPIKVVRTKREEQQAKDQAFAKKMRAVSIFHLAVQIVLDSRMLPQSMADKLEAMPDKTKPVSAAGITLEEIEAVLTDG